MNRRSPLMQALAAVLVLGLVCAGMPPVAHAQFFNDELGQDQFLENDELLFEPGTDEFGFAPEQDFTEGDQYVDESLLSPTERSITEGSRRTDLRIATEREMLPLNGAWGAGTGLLIGGWLALINQGDNRATQRSLGMGIVLGTIIGITVGMKTIIDPNAPSALGQNDAPAPAPASMQASSGMQPLLALTPDTFKMGFNLSF